jgi:3-oxoacyl-[acyl-carrier protein] reductase
MIHYNTSKAPAEASAEKIRALGVQVGIVQSNAASTTFGRDIVDAIMKQFPGRAIDVLINNAGDARFSPSIATFTLEDFADMFNSNVRGPLLLMQAAVPHMGAGGRIINLGTVVSRAGIQYANIYSATKGALNTMTLGWSKELAEKGITANVVSPGPVETDQVPPEESAVVQTFRAAQHIKRNGTAKEIADVVVFVASPASSFITGQVIAVDGGLSYV